MNFKFFSKLAIMIRISERPWQNRVNMTVIEKRGGGGGGDTKISRYIQSMLQVYSFPDRPYEKLKSRSFHRADKLTPVF